MIRATFLFALLCLLLGLSISLSNQILDNLLSPLSIDADSAPQLSGKATEQEGVAKLIHRRSTDYAQVIQKPIFFKDRRVPTVVKRQQPLLKPDAMQPANAAPPTPVVELKLLGVFVTSTVKSALISTSSAAPSWVSEGEKVGGRTVFRIEENMVVLKDLKHEERLFLYTPSVTR